MAGSPGEGAVYTGEASRIAHLEGAAGLRGGTEHGVQDVAIAGMYFAIDDRATPGKVYCDASTGASCY